MRDQQPIPFIGVRMHENRTPTGRRTSTPAKRAALYFAYGNERNVGDEEAQLEGRQRGEWLGPDGRIQSHETVVAWAKQEALRHRYTSETIFSVPQADLTPEEFCQAMQQESLVGGEISDWRLMAHRDTDYRHAHVLFFRDKRFDKKTFLSWQTDVRAELVGLEQQQPSVSLRPGAELVEGTGLNDRAVPQEMELDAGRVHAKGQEVGLGYGWFFLPVAYLGIGRDYPGDDGQA